MQIKEFNENGFKRYQLINDNNMLVEVLSLGGVITKIITEDRNGFLENVVLSYIGVYSKYCFGMWLSLVERFVRDEEAAGSNPVIPIM